MRDPEEGMTQQEYMIQEAIEVHKVPNPFDRVVREHEFDPVGRRCSCLVECGVACDNLTYPQHLWNELTKVYDLVEKPASVIGPWETFDEIPEGVWFVATEDASRRLSPYAAWQKWEGEVYFQSAPWREPRISSWGGPWALFKKFEAFHWDGRMPEHKEQW